MDYQKELALEVQRQTVQSIQATIAALTFICECNSEWCSDYLRLTDTHLQTLSNSPVWYTYGDIHSSPASYRAAFSIQFPEAVSRLAKMPELAQDAVFSLAYGTAIFMEHLKDIALDFSPSPTNPCARENMIFVLASLTTTIVKHGGNSL